MRTFLQGFKNLEDILSISIFKVTYLHISYLQGYLNASWHSHTPTVLFYLNCITLGVPSVFCDQSHLPSRWTVSSGSRLGLSTETPSLSWQLNLVLWPQHHCPCRVPWSLHGRVDVTQYSRLRIQLCSCSSSSFSDTLLLNSGLISWVQTFPWSLMSGTFLWSLTSGTFLCWDPLILFLAFLETPLTPLCQYSALSLLLCLSVHWLSYPISPTHLTISSISSNLNSFHSRLSGFQSLLIPQSSTITFSEQLSLTSLMRSDAFLHGLGEM